MIENFNQINLLRHFIEYIKIHQKIVINYFEHKQNIFQESLLVFRVFYTIYDRVTSIITWHATLIYPIEFTPCQASNVITLCLKKYILNEYMCDEWFSGALTKWQTLRSHCFDIRCKKDTFKIHMIHFLKDCEIFRLPLVLNIHGFIFMNSKIHFSILNCIYYGIC